MVSQQALTAGGPQAMVDGISSKCGDERNVESTSCTFRLAMLESPNPALSAIKRMIPNDL